MLSGISVFKGAFGPRVRHTQSAVLVVRQTIEQSPREAAGTGFACNTAGFRVHRAS